MLNCACMVCNYYTGDLRLKDFSAIDHARGLESKYKCF